MNGTRPRIADIGNMVEQLQRVDEGLPGLEPILQFEPDKPAIAAFQVDMGAPRRGTALKPRVIDPRHRRMAVEEVGDPGGVADMFPDPKRQGL